MWLVTPIGFFSIVQKPEDKKVRTLTIRARVRQDLEALRDKYLPAAADIISSPANDYPFRMRVPQSDFAIAAMKIALDIDYVNFKSEVAKKQGYVREAVYSKVWGAMLEFQHAPAAARSTQRTPKPAATLSKPVNSYGGVLFDDAGRVLLRRPKDDFDGYVWTFAKGKADPGETPEQTALRETKEETGYLARIVGEIPGVFDGGTGATRYFLMLPVGDPAPFDSTETSAIEWVKMSEARAYISKTTNKRGRARDLAVFDAAITLGAEMSDASSTTNT